MMVSQKKRVSLAVLGSTGRMGQWVHRLAQSEFVDSVDLKIEVKRETTIESLLGIDAVIDFASSDAMSHLASKCLSGIRSKTFSAELVPAFIIGSTGWTEEQSKILTELSKESPLLAAANFSTGVHALNRILRQNADKLSKLGYQPVITETHHIHKKDAPSGTAILLQKAINSTNPSSIQTHSIRAGEIVGTHEVSFFSSAEYLKLTHVAQERSIFARGALQTALWLIRKRGETKHLAGLFSLDDYFDSL